MALKSIFCALRAHLSLQIYRVVLGNVTINLNGSAHIVLWCIIQLYTIHTVHTENFHAVYTKTITKIGKEMKDEQKWVKTRRCMCNAGLILTSKRATWDPPLYLIFHKKQRPMRRIKLPFGQIFQNTQMFAELVALGSFQGLWSVTETTHWLYQNDDRRYPKTTTSKRSSSLPHWLTGPGPWNRIACKSVISLFQKTRAKTGLLQLFIGLQKAKLSHSNILLLPKSLTMSSSSLKL